MKNLKKLVITIFLFILTLFVLCSCKNSNMPETFELHYYASLGGRIIGETSQNVSKGFDASEVEAIADENYLFIKWSDGLTMTKRHDKEIVDNASITAYFVKSHYDVLYKNTAGGSLVGQASQSIAYSEDANEIIAEPAIGFKFVKWSDGETNPIRKDKSVQNDIEVTAIFEVLSFNAIYKADNGGKILGVSTQTITYGEKTSFVRAIANEGYAFVKWSDDFIAEAREDIILQDFEVVALFKELEKFTITYVAEEGGKIQGKCEQIVYDGFKGEEVKALADDGYAFIEWSDGNKNASRQDKPQNITYSAKFKKVFDGSGTQSQPYLIGSFQEFLYMRFYPDAHFKLTKDIDFSGVSFVPVFDDLYRFNGVFDGDNYSIKNLSIDKEIRFPSLMGFMDHGSKVLNLNLNNVSIIVPKLNPGHSICVGSIVSVSNGELENIKVDGKIIGDSLEAGSEIIGGLVGISYGKVNNCSSNMSIVLTNLLQTQSMSVNVGGLIGLVGGDVVSCSAKGEIKLTSNINQQNDIRNIGGLIGIGGDETEKISIKNSKSEVNIISDSDACAGGFIGNIIMSYTEYYISNCYSVGNIEFSKGGRVAGFIYALEVEGYSEIVDCFATGIVNANYASGFAFTIFSRSQEMKVLSCYSNGDIIGQSRGVGFADTIIAKEVINSYSTSAIKNAYNSIGFINSSVGNIKRCYYEGVVQGDNQTAGFINTSDGIVEECYSSGSIISKKVGVGFIFNAKGYIKNCFSTVDIIMKNSPETGIMACGMTVVNNAKVNNFYYAGKITGYSTARSVYGAIAAISHSDIDNCHWLYFADSPANMPYGNEGQGNWSRIYRYENISDMYEIANLLNDETEVWENIAGGKLPQFKKV